jgi:hypothetical protein
MSRANENAAEGDSAAFVFGRLEGLDPDLRREEPGYRRLICA